MKQKTRVHVVSHTHWDRAWYQTSEAYRVRLVELVDRLLKVLDQNSQFHSFMLDGQTVILEDYLAIRPEQRTQLEKYIKSGRIVVGPWYTSPDLFLAGGESVIRNLRIGIGIAKSFGRSMEVGYAADPFGHFAQMPQILKQFGISSYIFMRGMPSDIQKESGSIFKWQAPDGSNVLGVYLAAGYFPIGSLGYPGPFGRFDGGQADIQLAKNRLHEAVDILQRGQKDGPWLMLNGGDHMPVQEDLPQVLEELRQSEDDLHLIHSTLPNFVADIESHVSAQSLATYCGDLLGNADHPILQSVYSTRMYLKIQNHFATSYLTKYIEPFLAWFDTLPGHLNYRGCRKALLDRAWRLLLKNHPHDDICGCSIDQVHRENEVRFSQVMEIGNTLLLESLEVFTRNGFNSATCGEKYQYIWIYNPHPWEVRQKIAADVFFPSIENGSDESQQAIWIDWEEPSGDIRRSIVERIKRPATHSAYLETTHGTLYGFSIETVLPPKGYKILKCSLVFPDTGAEEFTSDGDKSITQFFTLTTADRKIALHTLNQHEPITNWLEFELDMDEGDTYSFGPTLSRSSWKAELVSMEKRAALSGVVYESIHRIDIPVVDATRFHLSKAGPLHIFTRYRSGVDGSLVLDIRYDNTVTNARLRALFATISEPSRIYVDHPFRLKEVECDGLGQQIHSEEVVTPTYPGEHAYATEFQGDFTILESENQIYWLANRGLKEVEILKGRGPTVVAVTLHRSVGMLSVAKGRIRSCQAGPSIEVPEGQCLRTFTHTLAFGCGANNLGQAIADAKVISHPPLVQQVPRLGACPADQSPWISSQNSFLKINNPMVELSAMYSSNIESELVIRCVNLFSGPQEASITLVGSGRGLEWQETDLCEIWDEHKSTGHASEEIKIQFEPNQIKTLLVRLERMPASRSTL